MSNEVWTAVDEYIVDHLAPADSILADTLVASAAAGLPAISVSPAQGKMLMLFAELVGAKRILEIGTLGGYSTIWLARGMAAGGRLITLEAEPKHAAVARENLARAGFDAAVEVLVGPALETLPRLTGPFDLIFIDADKASNAEYFAWAMKLSRKGTLILVDNVVRDGSTIDAANADPSVQGVRRLFEALAKEPRVQATAIQTVGSKGYDGFVMAVVTAAPL